MGQPPHSALLVALQVHRQRLKPCKLPLMRLHHLAPGHRLQAVTNLVQLLWLWGPPGSEMAVTAVSACSLSP